MILQVRLLDFRELAGKVNFPDPSCQSSVFAVYVWCVVAEYEHSELWVVADHLVAVQSTTLLLIPAAQGLEIGTVETSSLLRLRQPDYSCPLDIKYDWVGIVGLRTLLCDLLLRSGLTY